MDKDGQVVTFHLFVNGVQGLGVERHPVYVAVHLDAPQAEIADGAVDFLKAGVEIVERQGGDGGGEAVGVLFDQFRHFIVGEAAQIHGDFGRGDGFHRGGRQRKHLHVAFHAVHEPETGVEVEQCGDRFGVPGQVGTHVAVGHLLFEDGLILLGQDVVEGVDIQHGRLLTCRGCCWRCRACSAGSAA